MISLIEEFINKSLNDFVFSVFHLYLSDITSILYYLLKYSNNDLTFDELIKKAIYDGIVDDQFTMNDIEKEFGNDVDWYHDTRYDELDEDNFPFKKILEKFVKKNKSNSLGKLIILTKCLWENEKIVWVNSWGCSPPYHDMYEFIKKYKDNIKGIASWYTQNELLSSDDESDILYNPCDTEKHLQEGYCLDQESYLDLKKRIVPYLDKFKIKYIDTGKCIKLKFDGGIQMPNLIEKDLLITPLNSEHKKPYL